MRRAHVLAIVGLFAAACTDARPPASSSPAPSQPAAPAPPARVAPADSPAAEPSRAAAIPSMAPAAKKVAQWLAHGGDQPEFVTGPSSIEVVSRCGACDGDAPKTERVGGGAALRAWVKRALPKELDQLAVGRQIECERGCCSFAHEAQRGTDRALHLTAVCFAGTTPPVLVRVDFTGAW